MPKPSISNTLLAGRPARATHDAAADSFGRIAVFECLEALEGLQADAPPEASVRSPEGARLLPIVRMSSSSATSGPDTDWVAEEVPVALVYNGISHAVMMTTPTMLREFAVGFSLAEGIVASLDDIYDIEIEDACAGRTVNLEVSAEAFWKLKSRRRAMTGRTGCGVCGIESLEAAVGPVQMLPMRETFDMRNYERAIGFLYEAEQLGRLTGATHAAVWVNPDGTLAGGAEDVGRHVALDKLLGLRALSGWRSGALVVSSRASYEMVQKAVNCGVEILFAVSAPTALAVKLSQKSGLTLAAFCRRGRANIYTHPERLMGLPPAA